MKKHILVDDTLLLHVDQIESVNLRSRNEKPGGVPTRVIKITMIGGTTWTIYSKLNEARHALLELARPNLVNEIRKIVYRSRAGRESDLSKELKQIL